MRDYKFRGKRYNWEWVYGYYTCLNNVPKIINEDGIFDVLRDTVEQYIGKKDKNGKKIYEGDILYYITEFYGIRREHKKIVKYETNIYCDNFGEPTVIGYYNVDDCMEIIGNIHDNPELFGGKR